MSIRNLKNLFLIQNIIPGSSSLDDKRNASKKDSEAKKELTARKRQGSNLSNNQPLKKGRSSFSSEFKRMK